MHSVHSAHSIARETVWCIHGKADVYGELFLFQSVTTKDVTSGKVTKAAEKAQKKK